MEEKEIRDFFDNSIGKDGDCSTGIAAMKTLMEIIKRSKSETVQGLREKLTVGIKVMHDTNNTVAAINSGCELFLRFITLATLDTTFEECKRTMLDRGQLFLKKLDKSRGRIAKLAAQFVVDGSKVLTHSKSRVVLHALKEAAAQGKRFEVYVTVSAPDKSGVVMLAELEAANISCTLILDSAIGYVMEKVDFVMVGAEAVVESGGIINKIGTYTLGICAREMKKPLYVLTESFKFSRLYPLSQSDLPAEYKYTPTMRKTDVSKQDPLVDYTPPTYITLLFTDLGILTPSAVSDELIKLYL